MVIHFPKRLAEARKLRSMSQADLAVAVGMKPSAISHYETSTRLPSALNLVLLCGALGVSSDYLLGRTTEPEGQPGYLSDVQRRWMRMSVEDQELMWDLLVRLEPR